MQLDSLGFLRKNGAILSLSLVFFRIPLDFLLFSRIVSDLSGFSLILSDFFESFWNLSNPKESGRISNFLLIFWHSLRILSYPVGFSPIIFGFPRVHSNSFGFVLILSDALSFWSNFLIISYIYSILFGFSRTFRILSDSLEISQIFRIFWDSPGC